TENLTVLTIPLVLHKPRFQFLWFISMKHLKSVQKHKVQIPLTWKTYTKHTCRTLVEKLQRQYLQILQTSPQLNPVRSDSQKLKPWLSVWIPTTLQTLKEV